MVKNQISSYLRGTGFNEIMGLSLVRNELFPDVFPFSVDKLVKIHNTSNTQLEIMRPHMLISALETILHNQNRQQTDIKLFEFGHTYQYVNKEFLETECLSIAVTGDRFQETWLLEDQGEAGFYDIKGVVSMVLEVLGAKVDLVRETEGSEIYSSLVVFEKDGKSIATAGVVNHQILERFDIRRAVAYGEINWKAVLTYKMRQEVKFSPLSKFPKVRRDLAMLVSTEISYHDIEKLIEKAAPKSLTKIVLFDQYINEKALGKGKKFVCCWIRI